ncbi:MAG: adenylate/guanylate cyclase domain-containing protein, partial [Myxococcales bacterium]|nr:adenylate/guanylate cyclase domain-containing protein [Myxococcales bacterium]
MSDGVMRVDNARGTLTRHPLTPMALSDDLGVALRRWVPSAVTSRLDAGMSQYLSELRRVSVLFAGLPVASEQDRALVRIQPLIHSLQRAIYGFEGAINKISVDDKGAVLVAVFGLPPYAHEDNAVRASRAALAVQQALLGNGMVGSIGVTTGQVFCGTVGGDTRCEYTVLGHVVNLAARLMEAAKGGILTDEPTQQAARHKVGFEALPAIAVKGHHDAVAIFAPNASGRGETRARTPLVARLAEQAALRKVVDAALNRTTTQTGIAVGEAGIGKSRLTDEICEYAVDSGVRVVTGAGLPVERNIAYRAFRPLVEDLLELSGDDVAQKRAQVLKRVALLPDMRELAPLLEAIVPLDIEDNERTLL